MTEETRISFTPSVDQNTKNKETNIAYIGKSSGGEPVEGSITKQIGTGQNAKDSLVWITITYSFYIGSFITFALYLKSTFLNCGLVCSGSDILVEHIKSIWTIFIPLITLALGYIFGKGG